jgi:hypothetical protein
MPGCGGLEALHGFHDCKVDECHEGKKVDRCFEIAERLDSVGVKQMVLPIRNGRGLGEYEAVWWLAEAAACKASVGRGSLLRT